VTRCDRSHKTEPNEPIFSLDEVCNKRDMTFVEGIGFGWVDLWQLRKKQNYSGANVSPCNPELR
jgi:hypothetical protein